MEKEIRDLLKQGYTVDELERAFVSFFVEKNGLRVRKNELLLSALAGNDQKVETAKQLLGKEFATLSLHDLVTVFELLIPTGDKRRNGAFFTPQLITDFIADQTITGPDVKVCDPACGCGAFLIATVELIQRKYGKRVSAIVKENIFGADLTDYSVRHCKILLALLALMHGEDVNLEDNVIQADSLTVSWEQAFPELFAARQGFDIVIGNPPYVKFQDLPVKLRESLNTNWTTLKKGNYNLYFAFFELGMKILRPEGRLAYICPNNYFTSLAAAPLREYLADNKLLSRVIDFSHLLIFAAQTYTCITFLDRKPKTNFEFTRISDATGLAKINQLKYSKVSYQSLENTKWRLLATRDQENIRKIEACPRKLRELVNVNVGIATCKDSVYFLESPQKQGEYYIRSYQGKNFKVEARITRSIAKISDFKSQAELDGNTRRIIFPYKRSNGKMVVIPEREMRAKYPECYKYLLAAKAELGARDKGKKKYPQWYAYARTQGLNFQGKKLFTPTFSAHPRFLFSPVKELLFCNGYALFAKANPSLPLSVLSKILNSYVMGYYVENTSVAIEGGYPCYQKNFIEPFGIPDFSDVELSYLAAEENKGKIDAFLIRKYGLSFS